MSLRCLPAFVVLSASLLVPPAVLSDSGLQHRTRQTPPVKMGTSGGSSVDKSGFQCCGGTLGAIVLRDGVRHVLSNNHVLARSGIAQLGEDAVQPGLIDSQCRSTGSNIVGDFAGNLVPLGTGNVDAALSVARTNVDASGAILDVGVPCSAVQPPFVGLKVMKAGRTTGLTKGAIQAINMTVRVQYQRGCGSGQRFYTTFTNQISISPGSFSAGGDSGSLIVSDDGTPNPVGLLFAGSSSMTVANRAQDVVNAFSAGGHSFSFVGSACSSPNPGFAPGSRQSDEQRFEAARMVKESHERKLFGKRAVVGVGVGASLDESGDPAILVFVDESRPRPVLPAEIDGIPVRMIPTDPIIAR